MISIESLLLDELNLRFNDFKGGRCDVRIRIVIDRRTLSTPPPPSA
jgi:hypothetical protein